MRQTVTNLTAEQIVSLIEGKILKYANHPSVYAQQINDLSLLLQEIVTDEEMERFDKQLNA